MSLFRFILTCGMSRIPFRVMHGGEELFRALGRYDALAIANTCMCRNSTIIRWEIDLCSCVLTIWV